MAIESVEFEEGTIGIAQNLKSYNVGVVVTSDYFTIQEKSSVKVVGIIISL